MADPSSQVLSRHSPRKQDQQIFDIYNIYRLLLSLILLVSFLFRTPNSVLGAYDPAFYLQVAIVYLLLNFLLTLRVLLPGGKFDTPAMFVATLIGDILILVMISYSCGGVSSGVAHLLIVPVAAGSILVPGRLNIFLAAVGSIAVIYSEIYLYLTLDGGETYYEQAGLLGLTLFLTAMAMQVLGRRIRQNELLAQQQAARIESLQEMNYQIIQRMHTGIIVVNAEGHVLNTNSSARRLVFQGQPDDLEHPRLPQVLVEQLTAWQANPSSKGQPFRLTRGGPQLQASFAYLDPGTDANVLIFLEDYSLLTSRMQQLKLVSLGRLTASIAHEVRNPLGAISHAGQLLGESPVITEDDRKLVEMINNHSERVNSIIENILQLSRNNGEVPELLDAGEWLHQFVNQFANSYSETVEITLHVDPRGVEIRANPTQLEQLLTNLCDNGIRYSRQETGRPQLAIEVGLDPDSNNPYMDIIDEGPGIPGEDEEKIFEPFFTTESSGTGLGLYLCREICEANQAQLFYRRTETGKSCFRIVFAHPGRHIV